MRHSCRFAWSVVALAGVAASQNWSELQSAVPITAVTYDLARQRLLIAGSDAQQRLYEWDGSASRERLGDLAGQKTVEYSIWDRIGQRVLAVSTDRWVGSWSGGGWNWASGGQAPPANVTASLAFDEHRSRLVMVTDQAVYEWDGQQWWAIGLAPQAGVSGGGGFAYDPVLRRCLFYGSAPGVPGGTWSWSGFDWTPVGSNAPGPRARGGLAFDSGRQQPVLYGGNATATDTWTWNGTAWSLLPTTSDPGPQSQPFLVSDDQGVSLLSTEAARAGEIWQLRGNAWTRAGVLPQYPAGRTASAFAYDHARGQVVGFGGVQGLSMVPPDQTMLLDRRWIYCRPATNPPLRYWSHLAWSDQEQKVLLFGGLYAGSMVRGDTWSWNGTDWQQQQPAHVPPPRYVAVMTPDPLGGVLLFGGTDGVNDLGDQWHWNGTDWQAQSPAAMPPARQFAFGAYDPVRSQVVVNGGYSNAASYWNQTWVWDGTVWTHPATTVNPRTGTMAFWPAAGRVLAMGDIACEWTGSDWSTRTAMPSSLARPVMTTHFGRGQLLMVSVPTVQVLSSLRANSERYGTDCATSAAPALTGIDPPAPGAAFAIEVTTRASTAPTFLVLGFAAQNVPVGAGCRSLVGMQVGVQFAVASTGGVARFPLAIPNDNHLRGVQFTAQGAVWDPARSQLGSVTLTGGLRLTVGD